MKIIDSRVAILAKDVTDVGNGRFKYSAQGVYVGDKNATVMCQTPYIQTLGPSTGTECLKLALKSSSAGLPIRQSPLVTTLGTRVTSPIKSS